MKRSETMKKKVPPEVSEYMRSLGKMKTPALTAARKRNAARMNAAYTPERRREAAKKRLATLAKKQK